MASNIPITKGYFNKIKAEFGKCIWHGQTLQRIAYSSLILPKNRGGLNLHCVEQKSKALLTNRLMSLLEQLPFLQSFLENRDRPVPSACLHISTMIEKMEQLPDQLREALSSQGIYQHCISLVPDPGFVSADVQDWKAVFKNLHSNGLTSHQRSVCS